MTTEPETTEPAKSHAGSMLTSAAVLFVLLRLLAVSHYDWHTAFALLHTLDLDDAPGLFLGTFMADSRISSVLLIVALPFAFLYLAATRVDGKRVRFGGTLVLVVLVALLISHVKTYHRWWVPIGAAVLAVVLVLLERAHRHPRLRDPITFLLRRSRVSVVVAALVVAAVGAAGTRGDDQRHPRVLRRGHASRLLEGDRRRRPEVRDPPLRRGPVAHGADRPLASGTPSAGARRWR
ncbi:hypothetical protein ACFFQW_05085 [Umezawaea endophytica]|uniref:Uncharacterized protein n=1 Tax=Umezawaea endophytica TaxID=1654476 RepID=A0A9X2VGZ6_9PSEU|nr:hypothetical protein [Umezawaea endophytica]MCS7476254.1 hypothetical protein [Umezawaea endophytica]